MSIYKSTRKPPGLISIVAFGLVLTVALNVFATVYTSFSGFEIAAIAFPVVWLFLYFQFREYYKHKISRKR